MNGEGWGGISERGSAGGKTTDQVIEIVKEDAKRVQFWPRHLHVVVAKAGEHLLAMETAELREARVDEEAASLLRFGIKRYLHETVLLFALPHLCFSQQS